MITIASVLKSGGDYDKIYLERLALGVHRMLSMPHRFVCLTDMPEQKLGLKHVVDQTIPLTEGWPGWWSKMELFKLLGPVLYFDLDTVLTGRIEDLAEWIYTEAWDCLLMLQDFYRPDRSSGILGWNGDVRWIFEYFAGSYADNATWRVRPNATWMHGKKGSFRGDQEWLRHLLKKRPQLQVALAQDIFPGIRSFKVHVRGGSLPENTRVVCFHGRPRPHEINPPPVWMQKFWIQSWTTKCKTTGSVE